MRTIRQSLMGTLRVIINISAVLVAVAQAAGPEGSVKPAAEVAKEIDSYFDSLVSEHKLSVVAKDEVPIANKAAGAPGIAANFEMYPQLGYTSVVLMNSDPPTMMSIIMGIRQRISAQ